LWRCLLRIGAQVDDHYGTTKLDIWKVQGGMTTELDFGVGNVSQALKDSGLYANSVMILVSDNGGPLDHSNNWCDRTCSRLLSVLALHVFALARSSVWC
jgi:membrane-anchored protein YejM (alkaline phosphatase superfamily)